MSSSLRYFTVTSANSVAGQPDILTRVRLGDNLPFANALVFIPEGQQIPGAPIGTFAPFGGTFVINQTFLSIDNGDLLSAYARASAIQSDFALVTGTSSSTEQPVFDNGLVLKGFTVSPTAPGIFTADNAGYYRINAVIDIADLAPNRDVSLFAEADPVGATAFTEIPQGRITIIECPNVESLNLDVFSVELQAGGQVRVMITVSTSDGSIATGAPSDNYTVADTSRFEVNYLGAAPI